MISRILAIGALAALTLQTAGPSFAADANPAARAFYQYDEIHQPILSKTGMVSAQDGLAAHVGAEVLRRGGNAVDAAVAVGFALAVTHPQAGNLGGGGFMMLAEPDGTLKAIDFREMAPAAATRDMYLDADGDVDTNKAQFSRASAGVPGTVAGLLHALETYGTMTRRQVMGPAILLADRGFIVSPALAQELASADSLEADKSSINYFLGLEAGSRWQQSDLAESLRRIMRQGRDGFYKGRTADLIVAEMAQGAGLITLEDLAGYEVVERDPVVGDFNGYQVAAMPPPSSGGVHLVQMLNILDGYDLQADGHNSAAYLHKLIEAMRRAYADRSVYLGDPDFADVPVEALTDPAYADRLRETINLDAASRSADIRPGAVLPYEGPSTTHYSVMDDEGRAVSVTYTLNFSFGSGYSVDGAGFLLNNEMDDFSSKPGAPNGYGLVGGEANKIEPRKRPLSSMTPTILLKDGKPVLATGSPGGSTIITSVMQTVLNVMEWEMHTAQSLHAPRIHHQWLPDVVVVEPGISPDTLRILGEMGHIFPRSETGRIQTNTLGLVNSVGREGDWFTGAADPRAPDSLATAP